MQIPSWLADAAKSVPAWVARMRHPSGPGRYRFAQDAYEPYDLDSAAMAENTRFTVEGGISPEERRGWIEHLRSLQRPTDGLLIDERMERHIIAKGERPAEQEIYVVRRWTSRNGLSTIIELGGTPRYPLQHQECFNTAEDVARHLEGLDWKNPWGAGSTAGAIIWFHRINQMLGDAKAGEIIDACVNWLVARQDPATGAWSDGSAVPDHVLINGIFKVWIQAIPNSRFPVQYPEKVIDLCIRGMRESPALANGAPDACSIFDVALVLDTALRFTSHRRQEAADLAAAALPRLEPLLAPDGAFSYSPGQSLRSHGGLHLAPVKNQADMPGTAITCSAISLLCNLAGMRKDLGWAPTTETRMGL